MVKVVQLPLFKAKEERKEMHYAFTHSLAPLASMLASLAYTLTVHCPYRFVYITCSPCRVLASHNRDRMLEPSYSNVAVFHATLCIIFSSSWH